MQHFVVRTDLLGGCNFVNFGVEGMALVKGGLEVPD
jgi:hypothetical protein